MLATRYICITCSLSTVGFTILVRWYIFMSQGPDKWHTDGSYWNTHLIGHLSSYQSYMKDHCFTGFRCVIFDISVHYKCFHRIFMKAAVTLQSFKAFRLRYNMPQRLSPCPVVFSYNTIHLTDTHIGLLNLLSCFPTMYWFLINEINRCVCVLFMLRLLNRDTSS